MSSISALLMSKSLSSIGMGWRVESNVAARFFSSQKPFSNSHLGAPDYPTPGTEAYLESMKRLKDPRVLEMLSKKNNNVLHPSRIKIQKLIQEIIEQNAQLHRELHKLAQKVEKIEARLGNS